MNQRVSLVKLALGGLWCRLNGARTAPVSEEARQRFDSEYDAILAEIAASVASTNAARRGAARGQ